MCGKAHKVVHCTKWRQICQVYLVPLNVHTAEQSVFLPVVLGPVVQSIVILTSSLMTNSLAVVTKVFSNTLKFLLQKMWVTIATHIFSEKKKKKKKNQCIGHTCISGQSRWLTLRLVLNSWSVVVNYRRYLNIRTPNLTITKINASRKHAYIISTPLNPTFI